MKRCFVQLMWRVLLIGAASCSHSSSLPAADIRTGSERCSLPLIRTHAVINGILDDVTKTYSAVGGVINRIDEIATDTYEIWISQEERIDVLTYAAKTDSACHVQVVRTAERAESGS